MLYPPTADKARISEIFSSLQGEGIRMGEKHIFVRFEECHIHCKYCDELGKAGTDWDSQSVLSEIEKLEAAHGPHAFVSFTGGEPLLYTPFLIPLMSRLKEKGFSIYLETDGLLTKALSCVIGFCDCIAMDFKPSSVTGEKSFEDEHRTFLRAARESGRQTFIKVVVSKELDLGEFQRLVKVAAEEFSEAPFILQPLSGEIEGHEDPELMALLMHLQKDTRKHLSDVRILPRMHKILGLR